MVNIVLIFEQKKKPTLASILQNFILYPETRPIPVIIPPAGTSSLPYNWYPAN
jgi:hypothetical protein